MRSVLRPLSSVLALFLAAQAAGAQASSSGPSAARESDGLPFRKGARFFWFENRGPQSQAVLFVRQGTNGRARLLLDPSMLSAGGTVALSALAPSDDGKLLAYQTTNTASGWSELRVRAVDTGLDLADTVRRVKFSDISWTRDNRGFFYSSYDQPSSGNPGNANRFHKLYYHRIGTRQSADELVYSRSDQPAWRFTGKVSDNGQYLAISIREDTSDKNRLYFKDLASHTKPQINAPVVRLIDRPDASYEFVGNNGPEFVLRTNKSAPRGRLIGVDINNMREASWRTLIPESRDVLDRAQFVGDRLVTQYVRDGHAAIRFYMVPGDAPGGAGRPQGQGGTRRAGAIASEVRGGPYRFERELELPGPGAVVFRGNRGDREMFYSFSSSPNPPTIFRYDTRTGVSEAFSAPR